MLNLKIKICLAASKPFSETKQNFDHILHKSSVYVAMERTVEQALHVLDDKTISLKVSTPIVLRF